jgi:hypothetical protein
VVVAVVGVRRVYAVERVDAGTPLCTRIARKPCSWYERMLSNSSGRLVPDACPYASSPVRDAPPSSWYTGIPAALPLRSHSAMSTAAIAVIVTGPRRQ